MTSKENRKLKAKIIEEFGTQRNFSIFSGYHSSLVSEVVTGKRNLPKDDQERWALILKCSVSDLWTSSGSSPAS